LNFAQSFNAVGAALVPTFGAAFILSGIEHTRAERAAMNPQQLQAYVTSEADAVKVPYLVITAIFLFVATLIYFAHLPEVQPPEREQLSGDSGKDLKSILAYPHLIKGVIAQFFYVGAQVGVGSFVIRFVKHTMPSTPEKVAALFLVAHQTGFMIGRFCGSWMMKRIPAPRLLSLFGFGPWFAWLSESAPQVWLLFWLSFSWAFSIPSCSRRFLRSA